MTADLSALIARLEAAEAGSRELGHEVLMALGWRRSVVGHFYGPLYQWSSPDFSPHLISGDEDKLPNPALSLDAALALAERVLGTDQEYEITTLYNIARVTLNMNHGDESGPFYGSNDCCVVPLAICAATLRAKLDGYEVNKNPKAQEG